MVAKSVIILELNELEHSLNIWYPTIFREERIRRKLMPLFHKIGQMSFYSILFHPSCVYLIEHSYFFSLKRFLFTKLNGIFILPEKSHNHPVDMCIVITYKLSWLLINAELPLFCVILCYFVKNKIWFCVYQQLFDSRTFMRIFLS